MWSHALAETSFAINGCFLAEKLMLRLFREKESKALEIFGHLCPVLGVAFYMSRYLFIIKGIEQIPIELRMGMGLLWGFFLACTNFSAGARREKRESKEPPKE